MPCALCQRSRPGFINSNPCNYQPGQPLLSTRPHMIVNLLVTLLVVENAGLACEKEAPAPENVSTPAATGVADTSATVVPFHGLSLRIEPVASAEAILEASPGTPLRVIESRSGWLRVATWDGRVGWIPEGETFELSLWVHYQEALGGIAPSDLRPAYPLADGRWAVEAPFPSGMTTGSSVWVYGEPASVIGVTTIAEIQSTCGVRRMAILADRPSASTPEASGRALRADEPALDLALLAAPGAPSPRLRRLAPAPATPNPSAVRLLHAFATDSGTRPTLFIVERVDSGGPQIEMYAAGADDVRRLYAGYGWGC
ncbi:MAG: SH3 domain-containing protein [Acidobacteria bacterium]|nr:SH3 domain-containing protein [Acidobacteriota bacterium]